MNINYPLTINTHTYRLKNFAKLTRLVDFVDSIVELPKTDFIKSKTLQNDLLSCTLHYYGLILNVIKSKEGRILKNRLLIFEEIFSKFTLRE